MRVIIIITTTTTTTTSTTKYSQHITKQPHLYAEPMGSSAVYPKT
jgi:hypothetical protein